MNPRVSPLDSLGRARAAGQQPAWMMSVLSELERTGGEPKVSLVKKRLRNTMNKKLCTMLSQLKRQLVQRQRRSLHRKSDVQFPRRGVSCIHQ